MNKVLCKLLAVILDKGNPAGELRILGDSDYFLQNHLAWMIVWVGLACKNYLQGLPAIFEHLFQTFAIQKNEIRTFVRGKAACKAEGQYGWVQHGAAGNDH